MSAAAAASARQCAALGGPRGALVWGLPADGRWGRERREGGIRRSPAVGGEGGLAIRGCACFRFWLSLRTLSLSSRLSALSVCLSSLLCLLVYLVIPLALTLGS